MSDAIWSLSLDCKKWNLEDIETLSDFISAGELSRFASRHTETHN